MTTEDTDAHRAVDTGLEHDPIWMTRDEMVDHIESEHPHLEQIDPQWRSTPWMSHAALHNGEAEKITFYQAFGTEKDPEPHVKERVQPKHQSAYNECHNGIHSVEVKTYGDDTGSALVDIHGIDRQAVIDTWFLIIQNRSWEQWWPTG